MTGPFFINIKTWYLLQMIGLECLRIIQFHIRPRAVRLIVFKPHYSYTRCDISNICFDHDIAAIRRVLDIFQTGMPIDHCRAGVAI